MKKVVLFIIFLFQLKIMYSQFLTSIAQAPDSISNSLLYVSLGRFEDTNSKVYYKISPSPEIVTQKYSDTLSCLFEIKLVFNTIGNECFCSFSNYKEYFINKPDTRCDNEERMHYLHTYIQNDFSKRLYYNGAFDNDTVYFCLPIKFVPNKNLNDN